MEKKQYLKGICKEVEFSNGGSVINISIAKADLDALVPNEKGYINLVLAKKKEKGKYGDTHYIYLNDFKATGYQSPDLPF